MKKNALTFALVVLLALPAMAQDTTSTAAQDTTSTTPYTQPDDSWISISGTVEAVTTDAFTLDYGEGVVTVEMDDWNADADAYKVVEGDTVTVYGVIDDDFFETATIEASSVYVEGLDTYFYASAADEEDTFVTVTTPVVVSTTVVQGTVTDVDVDEQEFTISTGTQAFVVETSEMGYNPLDDEGFQQIEEGDRVSVSGTMDTDFFEGRELVADTIVTLSKEDENAEDESGEE